MLPTRDEANDYYAEVISNTGGDENEEWKVAARYLCQYDLFFLLTVGMGRLDADRDWIYDRCVEVQDNPDGRIDLWARFHYKMVRVGELVPTPFGMRPHGSLEPGDAVFGPDGMPTKVLARTQVFTDGECFRVTFDKGYSVVVGKDHLWTVEVMSKKRTPKGGREGQKSVTVNTARLMELVDSARMLSTKTSPRVGACKPLEFPYRALPLEPYTLGAWLGDGTSESGNITCGDAEVFDRIAETYRVSGDKTPDRTSAYRKIDGMAQTLRRMGILGKGKKRIPEEYQIASVDQRVALLNGLMDTDGACDTRGTATFVNINGFLARDVFRLCASLGLKPSIRKHVGKHNGDTYPFWQVSFQARAERFKVFGLARKQRRATEGTGRRSTYHRIVAVDHAPTEPCSCIQVEREDGQYLLGEQCIATHNSTIITMAKTIQDILLDQNIATVILSYNRPTAKSFMLAIRREFEMNANLKRWFDDVLWKDPDQEAPKWSEDGFIVQRTANKKEATVEAYGLVDGQPTGRHYDLMVYDDVVTLDAVTSPEMIQKVTTAWELSRNLQRTDGGTKTRYVGTRYSLMDTYRVILDRNAAIPRIHGPTIDGTKEIRPDNCALMPYERLSELQRETKGKTFQCQMFQDPLADESIRFQMEWIRFWKADNLANLNIYMFVDPATKKKKKSDYTTLWVVGIGPDDNWYVIDGLRDRLGLTERADALFSLHKQYRPLGVGYEEYGMQADIEHMKDRMERENYRFDITALGGKLSKEDRIGELEPLFRNGRLYFPEHLFRQTADGPVVDMVRVFLDEEYSMYPNVTHEDMLDCLARIRDPNMSILKPSASLTVAFQPNRFISGNAFAIHGVKRGEAGYQPARRRYAGFR